MRATELLTQQFKSVNAMFHDIAGDLTDEEWTTRFLPGTNLPGFDLWHVARAQDWAVQTLTRGVAEVSTTPDWAHRGAIATIGIGVGMTVEEADDLASHVRKAEVLSYTDAITQEILVWLATFDDDLLDLSPDITEHYSVHPEYRTPAMMEETPWVATNPPRWRCLAPAIGHARDHLAEIDLGKRLFRQGVTLR